MIGEEGAGHRAVTDQPYFIGDFSSSEEEDEAEPVWIRESSPPLLLAFPLASGRASNTCSLETDADLEEEQTEDEGPIEDWMILCEDGQEEGDSRIQINLSYGSSSESEPEDKDEEIVSVNDAWAVSERDKKGVIWSQPSSFSWGRILTCQTCNRTGHLSKNCFHQKRSLLCGLCGTCGHPQRFCPGLRCLICGRPPHGAQSCEVPAIWKQQCQRCRMIGHLSDACPDTWRQYHRTISSGAPVIPQSVQEKSKRSRLYCYNCGLCGHHGFECMQTRMVSGTFPSLPYICHYDSKEEFLQLCTSHLKREHVGIVLHPESAQLSPQLVECNEKQDSVNAKSKTKPKAYSQAPRRKTWPERRRERRQVKLLRREAQAMRGGGTRCSSGDAEICPKSLAKQPSPISKKMSRETIQKNRCRQTSGKWKRMRRGGLKCRELCPHSDSDGHFFTNERVCHRRR